VRPYTSGETAEMVGCVGVTVMGLCVKAVQ